ncbi:MAG TPA: hypothetical protein VGS41_03125 [Chthonomonadales bacterium]|nr:hypothetical protein [Chthonomonadales bacterium]
MSRLALLAALLFAAPGSLAACLPQTAAPNELYRVRIENRQFGRLEVSLDGGDHYLLIGRVLQPASSSSASSAAHSAGVVLSAGQRSLCFSAGSGRALKISADSRVTATGKRDLAGSVPRPDTLQTNLAPGTGLFGAFLPRAQTEVELEMGGHVPEPIPPLYAPASGDVFVILVAQTNGQSSIETSRPALNEELQSLAKRYSEGAVRRARLYHNRIVSGILTLNARLPEGEPDPIQAVTFRVDDDLLAVCNVAPYSYPWDTRRAVNGEHVVEIQAVDAHNTLVTHATALVVVENPLPASHASH